ncbi:hypothetical protein PO909_015854, partial [Leuciscus waleckii]
ELHGYSGKHIIISCSHKLASNNIKYFCRDPCEDRDILVQSDQSPKGRYKLEDSGTGTFNVTITDLQGSDSGIYWCGVDRTGLDTYQEVNLTVSKASSNTTVYILYAVGGLVIAVIIFVVAVHQYRKKVKTSASSVTPVNKRNEGRDEQEDSLYENDTPNTDKSTPRKPINRPEVPKSQVHTVYENVQLNMGQSHELYENL